MADRKTHIYRVERPSRIMGASPEVRLIASNTPQGAKNFASKDVTVTLASAIDVYKSGLKVENLPEEPARAQAVIPMTAPGQPLEGAQRASIDDDIRYASQG